MLRKIFLLAIVAGILMIGHKVNTASPKADVANKINQVTNQVKTSVFNKTKFSTTDPNSIWVVVNKKHALSPVDYAPSDLVLPNIPLRTSGDEMKLRKEAATALEAMNLAGKKDGVKLMVSSAYRSYAQQKSLYASYVARDGQTVTDTQSARAGYSEHQTGLAVDLEPSSRSCEIDDCFANTAEGKWLAGNAYKYGFILRYQSDKVNITGYKYEAWHFRYVGTELASQMHLVGITTLEEFFNVTGGTSY